MKANRKRGRIEQNDQTIFADNSIVSGLSTSSRRIRSSSEHHCWERERAGDNFFGRMSRWSQTVGGETLIDLLDRERELIWCSIGLSNLFLFSSDLSWKKSREKKKKKRNTQREKKQKKDIEKKNQTNKHSCSEGKHGQHIRNEGPKQTTRNVHAADKDVCKSNENQREENKGNKQIKNNVYMCACEKGFACC